MTCLKHAHCREVNRRAISMSAPAYVISESQVLCLDVGKTRSISTYHKNDSPFISSSLPSSRSPLPVCRKSEPLFAVYSLTWSTRRRGGGGHLPTSTSTGARFSSTGIFRCGGSFFRRRERLSLWQCHWVCQQRSCPQRSD